MAKVTYNGDVFRKELIPNMTESKRYLESALNTDIYFAEEDFGWSNVKTELNDTYNKTVKYIDWANDFVTKMDNSIINNNSALSSIKIPEVKSTSSKVANNVN